MPPYQPPRELHVHGPRIRVLFAQIRNVGHWRFADLRAPYWRLYHLADAGAWIQSRGGRTDLLPGNLYLLPAHFSFASGSEREVDQLFIHFTLDPEPGLFPGEAFSIATVPLREGLDALLTQVRREEDPEFQALLLAALVRATLAGSGLRLRHRDLSTRMEKAQQLLRDHLREGIRNHDLARALHLSENGFVRWFSAEAGISPQAWLARERVHEAGFWLHHTDAPLEQIAELHGFCDRYHFSRVFKKHQGISPAAFRRNREPAPHPLMV